MIRHILKKDCRLLWRLVLGVVLINWANHVLLLRLGHFQSDYRTLQPLANLFFAIATFGNAFLIAAVVQLDPIPGVRQDWLVRPVKRRDLLLAKLLFVLLTVHLPILIGNLIEGSVRGFSLAETLGPALSYSVYWLIGFSLPVLAFASFTRSWTELVVAGVVAFMSFAVCQMLAATGPFAMQFDPTWHTGIGWVTEVVRFAIVLLGVSLILRTQYVRRGTALARGIAIGTFLLCVLTQFVPWQPAFAVEKRLSAEAGAGNSIHLAFAPELGKYRNPSGIGMDDLARRRSRWDEADTALRIPLHITGIPNDAALKTDRSEIRLIGPEGVVLNMGPGDDLQILKEGASDGEARLHHGIRVRTDVYNRMRNTPLRLEVAYSLTLWRLASSEAIPALNGDQRMPELGWCLTRINPLGTAVVMQCIKPGGQGLCLSAFIEHAPSGRRNPSAFSCNPDYSPYFGWFRPDPFSRGGGGAAFRDARGQIRYPVDGSQLTDARLVMRFYEPRDHFQKQLVVSDVRLQDWVPE